MLRLAGEDGIAVAERIERVYYNPGVQDSGDLEPLTRTITATAEAVGLANRDYQVSLTLSAPSDARLAVLRIATRLAVTIDSMMAGQLNCRVYVDSQATANRLFDLSWTTAGAKLAVVDTHAGNLATIFNLLKDGAAHTFYFFFWVNTGNAVLSQAQLWEAVGTSDTGFWGVEVVGLTHTGLVSICSRMARIGTGTPSQMLLDGVFDQVNIIVMLTTTDLLGYGLTSCMVKSGMRTHLTGSVATDLNYLVGCTCIIRSEQWT